ncbi:hypothetical protein KX928_00605 [Roseobacter sp. YSTF-M11]|uniref:Lipoprotein n=1 Tax=Roseobacter insulae TaxID=2859783 RepID=A0A9X1FRY4_9RHOB|nr:hypothetical protein [Roseobacter insulae]MBW4706279.1 hypothetical protein [Roseobacter insulae]
MKVSLVLLLCGVFALSGCYENDQYPITGEECGPNDPVKDMSIPNCPPGL